MSIAEVDGKRGILLRREPLTWVSSLDFLISDGQAVDVVAAPAPCIYRAHLQKALQEFKLGWNLRLTSSSYDAICAAVRTGLGLTVLADSVVPDGLRKLTTDDGLKDLPDVELRLHYDRTTSSDAANRFVEFARERLGKGNAAN
jgi:DNA-binding transcriptional LysR family regulator